MRQSAVLEDLRARIARIEGAGARHGCIHFGSEEIDVRLPGGGLATGALHEAAGGADLADARSGWLRFATSWSSCRPRSAKTLP